MWTYDGCKKLRLLANKLKMPGVVFWSRYGIFFPPGVQLHTIVGRGVGSGKVYGQGEEPSQEDIDRVHKLYMEEIQRMYDVHKEKNGNTPIKFY